jgi:glutamyl-tRNA synthetase
MNFNNILGLNEFKKMNESKGGEVRVRFAPSPTGPLHIGGVRTALYNYLFAKKNKGKMILRIEDTDRSRFVPGAEDYIIESLNWLGIEFDEGPHVGGPYGPYKQSERKDIYRKYYKQLIDSGKAYYAFDTEKEMNEARKKNPHFAYDSNTRMKMRNSLTLPPEEVDRLLKERNDWTVRIKFNPNDKITVNDIIRGRITVDTTTLDDKVIFKAKDDLPTYHLANIVDDHLMKISHVIRGEEWLPSAPLHVYLYESLGWESPEFAHLPLILKPVGNGKLSKRDGDKYGFPVFPIEWENSKDKTKSMGYREEGYLPDAVVNILAFLGWNPGTEKEVYTMDDLIKDFSLKKVQKAGAKFNMEKAKWFNNEHIKKMDNDTLSKLLKSYLEEKGIILDDDKLKKVVELGKGRAKFIKDIYDNAIYLFKQPEITDRKTLRKKWKDDTPEILLKLKEKFEEVKDWNRDTIKKNFEEFVSENDYNFGAVMPPLRLIITGMGFGSDIFEILELIGQEETVKRLNSSMDVKK